MRMVDIIEKKRNGDALTNEEIHFFIDGYVANKIPDYQISALLMAIVFQGMNHDEIVTLTDAMEHSGETMNLSNIIGPKVDKHSTGGVGDKTSIALSPMVAACGGKVAKMSGRGLGHTGGTLDKLESIPGMNVYMKEDAFVKQVNDIGLAIAGQTSSLVPADKKLYALRDVTGTIQSIPLIASSIMSKKLASGTDCILLDVKFGDGAFMKTVDDATKLAKIMCEIGNALGRDTRAVLTDMSQPLGKAIGNALEVKEAIATLHGEGPKDFEDLCLESGSIMLVQSKIAKDEKEGREMLKQVISDGSAFNKLVEMIKYQGGDTSYILNPDKFPLAKNIIPIYSDKAGYVKRIGAYTMGISSMKLGGGRETFDDVIDMSAGIILNKKVGDFVEKNELLCVVHTNKENVDDIIKDIKDAYLIVDEKVEYPPTVHQYIK